MEFLYVILIVLAVTRLIGEAAERLGQPSLLGEIVGGIALGGMIGLSKESFPILSEPTQSEAFTAITDLAVFFLMLLAGIQLKPEKLAKATGKAVPIALGGFLLPLGAGFLLAWVFLPASELKATQSLFVGTALAITAIPVAVRILLDVGQLNSQVGNLIVSSALLDDIFSLILLGVLVAVVDSGAFPSTTQFAQTILHVAIFFAITILVGLYVVPRVASFVNKAHSAEFEFSAIILYALIYSILAEMMGLHFILGAFVAGVFFRRSTVSAEIYDEIVAKMSAVSSGLLAPIFFAWIGLNLTLAALVEIPLFVALLVLIAFIGKFIGAGIPAYMLGSDKGQASAVGVAMSARGTIELIIADIALRGGVFSAPNPPPPIVQYLFSAVVIVAVLTTILTSILLPKLLLQDDV